MACTSLHVFRLSTLPGLQIPLIVTRHDQSPVREVDKHIDER